MAISVRYPLEVKFGNGSTALTTDNTWTERLLVVETDRSETEIRDMLSREGFGEVTMEYPKSGRLGRGMSKRFKDWQVHIRLFQHGNNIQIDGEVEVSAEYCEHLTHGWLPAFDLCADMIRRHFGGFWVYHKGYRQYVTGLVREYVLSLGDPESKTSVAGLAVAAGLALGVGLLVALSKD